jgi:murein L,D-transpeptidase YafK
MTTALVCCRNQLQGKPATGTGTIDKAVDSLVVIKHDRLMTAYHRGTLLKTFHICLGPEPVGKKHFQNDGKTPEGIYRINSKNPASHYHKCLGVSYPNDDDRAYARRYGKPTGGDIKIHGLPNGKGALAKIFSAADWTLGCIAVTDEEIDELYEHVDVGIRIAILP